MLIGQLQKFVLPDFQMFRPGTAPCWVEVKYKDHADKYQKLQQWQHGIDLPNWRAYLEVNRKPAWVDDWPSCKQNQGRKPSIDPCISGSPSLS